jgi:hypothetical protein
LTCITPKEAVTAEGEATTNFPLFSSTMAATRILTFITISLKDLVSLAATISKHPLSLVEEAYLKT